MCAIVGAVVHAATPEMARRANEIIETVWGNSLERGRDGAGWQVQSSRVTDTAKVAGEGAQDLGAPHVFSRNWPVTVIGNRRAEPTTEHVNDKRDSDQQPYWAGDWAIVHNGTIANDKVLRTGVVSTTIDSAAIAEHLDMLSCTSGLSAYDVFVQAVRDLKGSFAILATNRKHPGLMYVAANYRPIWFVQTDVGTFFASARHYFPAGLVPQMLKPYSVGTFGSVRHAVEPLYPVPTTRKTALVVCSGGLDSVVAATVAHRRLGYKLHLIHFLYGSRAEGPEVQAVKDVALELDCELTLFPLNVYSKGDSPLLDSDATVAGGEAGAEFAHEWVPARNLLLLSVATAFAEARGYEIIVLGNNLEEAGAYPDNEPEFIAKFNDMLPFAVGDGKRMQVIMPVGNLMKHEIVALGHSVGAPMHLTWSCYRAGTHHCGKCGPCYMRRKAFEINQLPEVIDYVQVD